MLCRLLLRFYQLQVNYLKISKIFCTQCEITKTKVICKLSYIQDNTSLCHFKFIDTLALQGNTRLYLCEKDKALLHLSWRTKRTKNVEVIHHPYEKNDDRCNDLSFVEVRQQPLKQFSTWNANSPFESTSILIGCARIGQI